jgi:hypothetical protein
LIVVDYLPKLNHELSPLRDIFLPRGNSCAALLYAQGNTAAVGRLTVVWQQRSEQLRGSNDTCAMKMLYRVSFSAKTGHVPEMSKVRRLHQVHQRDAPT